MPMKEMVILAVALLVGYYLGGKYPGMLAKVGL